MKGFKELSLVALSLLSHTIHAEPEQVPIGVSPVAEEKSPESTAPAEPEEPTSDVHVLTADNFTDFINQHSMVFAEFYAPWCGHCQKLEPHYEKAATQLKGEDLYLAKVDCTLHKEVCEQHDVKGFPTLKLFKNGVPRDYNNARETQAIVDFMYLMSKPATSPIDIDSHDDFSNSHKIVVVGYFKEDDTKSHETFAEVAEQLRDSYVFGTTHHEPHAEAAEVKFPSVVLYKQYDEGKNVHDGDITVEDITKFAKISATPFVGEIGPETYADYMEAGIPLSYIFYENEEQKEKLVEIIKPLAKKYKGKLNFGAINAELYGAHAPNLNLKQEPWPAFAIQDTVKNFKYPFDQEKEITLEEITTFVEEFIDGKLAPTIKSEPIPEKQEGPVHITVAHNFEEIVMDNEKDVLIKFYAPHCGHCKNLAPKYDQLGSLYFGKEDFGSKVVIAKFDCMNNDLPPGLEIQGFPTLKLYPAKAKHAPVDYEGDRSLEDMANFVKENGHHKTDAYVATSDQEKESESDDDFLTNMFGEYADNMKNQAGEAEEDSNEEDEEKVKENAEETAESITDKIKETVDAASEAMAGDDEGIHDEL